MRSAFTKAVTGILLALALGGVLLFGPEALTGGQEQATQLNVLSAPAPIATTAPIELPVATEPPTGAAEPTSPPAVATPAEPTTEPQLAPAVLPTSTPEPEPTRPAPVAGEVVETESRRPGETEPDDAGAAAAAAAAEPDPTATPEPTSTPAATSTPQPVATATPEPTAVPTSTPEPTAVPTATPEPSPEPTPTAAPQPTAVPEPTATPEPDMGPDDGPVTVASGWMYVNSDTGLYVRDEPAGEILIVLTNGAQIFTSGRVINTNDRLWTEIEAPVYGWAALSFLTTAPPVLPELLDPGEPGEPPSAADWAALRDCESGGRYDAVDPSGLYHGAYQFLPSTWDGLARRFFPHLVGVLPSEAAPADQDMMAQQLYQLEGAGPWPACGRFLL